MANLAGPILAGPAGSPVPLPPRRSIAASRSLAPILPAAPAPAAAGGGQTADRPGPLPREELL